MRYIEVSEFKPLHEAPRRLAELEEQLHTLQSIRAEDGQCIAVFPNGEFALPLDLHDELEPLVGREIAILKLESRYYVREVVEGA